MAPLISLGGMKMSSSRPPCAGRTKPKPSRCRSRRPATRLSRVPVIRRSYQRIGLLFGGGGGDGPLLAVGFDEMAGGGEAGEMFEEEAAFAASAERELADELLVSGALAGGSLDAAEEFAVGHRIMVRRLRSG